MFTNSRKYKLFLTAFRLLAISGAFSAYAYGQTDLQIPPIRDVMRDSGIESPTDLDSIKDDFAVSIYISAIVKKIEHIMFSWPQNELRDRVYGSIAVTLIIGIDGSLLDVYPIRLEGAQIDARLIESVIKIAKRAEPFPPPPQTILRHRRSVKLSRVFHFTKER